MTVTADSAGPANSTLESVPCPICGSFEVEAARMTVPRDTLAQQLGAPDGRSSWVVCEVCAMVYQSPRPRQDVVDALYLDGGYHEDRGGVPEHYVRYSLRRSAAALAWGLPIIGGRPGRALDIGCGIGGAMSMLASDGWDVVGVEPDPMLSALARDRFALDVSTGYFDANTAGDLGEFDLAYSCHVFEHLQHPDETASIASAALRARQGHLFIVVPTFRDARTNAWACFNASHTLMFTHVSLTNLLARHGFETVAHRYAAGADSELWLIAKALPELPDRTPMPAHESLSAVQAEIAAVRFRQVLGLPRRASTHASTFRADPKDFVDRARRSLGVRVSHLRSRWRRTADR